jgi:hypothetical protein
VKRINHKTIRATREKNRRRYFPASNGFNSDRRRNGAINWNLAYTFRRNKQINKSARTGSSPGPNIPVIEFFKLLTLSRNLTHMNHV